MTMRRIVINKPLFSLVAFFFLTWIYLFFAQAVKTGINIGEVFYAITVTFVFISASMYWVGKLFGGKGEFISVLCVWVFSYIPTLFWFILTTILFILLPPPRTQSMPGQIFSVFFIFISLGLLLWKLLLYFLTLRFSLKLNLWQMMRTTMVLFPLYTLFFLLMNRMQIFKVPFA